MVADIIWYLCSFGCAALFFGIGIYAQKLEKPMWFWSGVEVNPTVITDIPQYNQENGRMWKYYSLWYWAAGLCWHWRPGIAVAILVLGGSLGTVLLVRKYLEIEKKYKKTGL